MRVSKWLRELVYGPEAPNTEDIVTQLEHDREIVKAKRELTAMQRELAQARASRLAAEARSQRSGFRQ